MAQFTTSTEGFDTVSQAGSDVVWSGISNMPYPTEGEAEAKLGASNKVANDLFLKIPHEAAGIPNGSAFDEMQLLITIKKTCILSGGTNVLWYFGTNYAPRRFAFTQTTDETYQSLIPEGDAGDWGLTSIAPATIIENLKDGSLYFKLEANLTASIACNILIKLARVNITYTTREGKRGALIATLV